MDISNQTLALAEKLGIIDTEADTQEALIEQIITALDSKISRYEEGVRDENERFWKVLQTRLVWSSGNVYVEEVNTDYSHRFKNWYTATEINPLYPIQIGRGATTMFESCMRLENLPPMTFLQPVSTYAMFNGCMSIKEAICDFRLTGNCSAMFNSCQNLTKVNKLIIEGTCTWNSMSFAGCKKLVELNIEGTIDTTFVVSDCKSLNRASIDNIIGCLSTTTSGLTCTLSRTAVNKAYETSEGANDGSTSEESEWNDLVATRTNWTISLL